MDKIDIRDIRVGNLVYSSFSNAPCKVTEIRLDESGYGVCKVTVVDGYKDVASLSPIPLTREILEKNGFVEMDSGYYRYFLAYDENHYAGFESVLLYPESYRIIITKEEVDGSQSQYKGKWLYLHQLQNILRDLGIEKEITI